MSKIWVKYLILEFFAKKIVSGFLLIEFIHIQNSIFKLLSTNQIMLNNCTPVESELLPSPGPSCSKLTMLLVNVSLKL